MKVWHRFILINSSFLQYRLPITEEPSQSIFTIVNLFPSCPSQNDYECLHYSSACIFQPYHRPSILSYIFSFLLPPSSYSPSSLLLFSYSPFPLFVSALFLFSSAHYLSSLLHHSSPSPRHPHCFTPNPWDSLLLSLLFSSSPLEHTL